MFALRFEWVSTQISLFLRRTLLALLTIIFIVLLHVCSKGIKTFCISYPVQCLNLCVHDRKLLIWCSEWLNSRGLWTDYRETRLTVKMLIRSQVVLQGVPWSLFLFVCFEYCNKVSCNLFASEGSYLQFIKTTTPINSIKQSTIKWGLPVYWIITMSKSTFF